MRLSKPCQRLETNAKFATKEIPRIQRRALAASLTYYRDEFTDSTQDMGAAYATGDCTLQATRGHCGECIQHYTQYSQGQVQPGSKYSQQPEHSQQQPGSQAASTARVRSS